MATMDSGSRSSSVSSFFSDQLDDEVIEEGEDLAEYDSAPRDIYGVHDTDGQIIAVRKGESLPFTTKYKRKNSSSKAVKFHVNKKLQVDVIAYEPKLKKKKSSEISPGKGDGGLSIAGEQSPQLSLQSEKSPQSSQLSQSPQSSQLSVPSDEGNSGDEGHLGAGRSRDAGEKKSPQSPGDCAGKKLKNQNEFVTELDQKFEEKIIDGLEAGLRLPIKEKLENDTILLPKENNAILNSLLQYLLDQYGPVRPDKKFCERLAELLRCKFPATFREKYVVSSTVGKFDIPKLKGEGGYRDLATRIGEQFYNRNVRPTIKKPVIGEAEIEEPAKKKGKQKKTYCLNPEKWDIDRGATRKAKEEAQKQFRRFCDAESIEEKKKALMEAVVFVQKQFREKEPSQTVEDLDSFWEAGPEILSLWFEWLVDGSKDGHLATTVSLQMTKVLNIIEAYIIDKRGEEAEKDLARIKEEAREANGDSTMYQLHLIRDLAKLFKNKAEKFIFIDAKDDKKSGPDETIPNIYITKRDTFGEDEFREKILMNLRIGDKTIWTDISLPQALAGVTQIYFSFNMMYPSDIDDILQFNERILCNFGTDDGARNPRNIVKKCFREFKVTYESLKILRYFNPIFSGICWYSAIEV